MQRRLVVGPKSLQRKSIGIVSVALFLVFICSLIHGNVFAATDAQIINYRENQLLNSESDCSASLKNEGLPHRDNVSGNDKNFDNLRQGINDSNPYDQNFWITDATTSPIQKIGTQKVGQPFHLQLQLNTIEFICSIVVQNNSDQTYPNSNTILRSSDFDSSNDPSNPSTVSKNYPNDHSPVPDGHNLNAASLYTEYFRVTNASVQNGGSGDGKMGTLNSDAVNRLENKVLTVDRHGNNGTRFWVGNPSNTFRYNSPTHGFPNPTDVTINFTVAHVKSFHDEYNGADTVTDCSNGHTDVYFENYDSSNGGYQTVYGGGKHIDPRNLNDNNALHQWAQCNTQNLSVTFHVDETPPQFNKVQVSGADCSITGTATDPGYPKSELTVRLSDNNGNKKYVKTVNHVFTFDRSDLGAIADETSWNSRSLTLQAYGVQAGNNAQTSVTVGPCADVRCAAPPTIVLTAGVPASPSLRVKALNASSRPPNINNTNSPPDFRYKIAGPGGFNISKTTPYNPPYTSSGDTVYLSSDPIQQFTPIAGTYTISWDWSYVTAGNHTDSNTTTPYQCSVTVKAAYAPYFSIQNGDVSVGNGFDWGNACGVGTNEGVDGADITASNLNGGVNGSTYSGAGSQLGALSTGTITNFVSGLNLSSGVDTGHTLSFANYNKNTLYVAPNFYGSKYALPENMPCVHNYRQDALNALSATSNNLLPNIAPLGGGSNYVVPTTQMNSLASGTYKLSVPSNPYATIIGDGNDITINSGTSLTIYARGNVYINSNIKYGNYSGMNNIPSFTLIVSGKLYIAPTVKNLQGIYVVQRLADGASGGSLSTCATIGYPASLTTQVSTSVDYATCSNPAYNPLTFTGAVMVENGLYLERTYGNLVAAGSVPASPSEVFQYSPEVWLNQPTNSTLVYQSYTGLPPVL